MPTRTMPICLLCTHFRAQAAGLTCDAFPDGIPAAILESRADHRRAFRKDGGVRFDPTSDVAADYADKVFPRRAARRPRHTGANKGAGG